ncbi:MAG TPA: hypothetical protein VHR42_08960 [Clostridia bacterium]|nr:hypothetical protein [Clostridia bacterium]
MEKKYFDKKLYLNGLKQLRLTGSIILILTVFSTALPALLMILDAKRQRTGYTPITSMIVIQLSVMSLIAPIILCLTLFSFLNSRKGSDFYHSLPNTRVSIFWSFAASVLSWLLLSLMFSLIITVVIYASLGASIIWSLLPFLILTQLSGMALITAAMLLAMSITGTYLTNLTVFALILLLPRCITTMFTYTLKQKLRVITFHEFGIFGDPNYNIPIKFILYPFNTGLQIDSSQNGLITSSGSILYTFILALVYFGLACLLFHLRKSETAGRSAPNRILQHVFRCAVTLPVALIIPLSIVLTENSFLYWSERRTLLIAVITISLIVYFLFELITTKKLKNLPRSAPVLLFVVAIDFIFVFFAYFSMNRIYNTKPVASDMESVAIQLENADNTSNRTQYFSDLSLKALSLRDSKALSAVSASLAKTIDKSKSQSNNLSLNSFVKIKLKSGRTLERYVDMTKNQYQIISEAESKDASYQKALASLPTHGNIQSLAVTDLSASESKRLWDTFQSEYKSLSFSDKEAAVMYDKQQSNGYYIPYSGYSASSFASIHIMGFVGLENFESYYPIGIKTPKTLRLYVELENQKYKDILVKLLQKSMKEKNSTYSYTITAMNFSVDSSSSKTLLNYGNQSTVIAQNSVYDSDDDGSPNRSSDHPIKNDKTIFALLQKQINDPIDLKQPIIEISLFSDNTNGCYSFYMPVSEDSAVQIVNLKQNS